MEHGFNALSGLRVVELGQMISAPFAAKVLAALGAEVIKIERPGLGDPSRSKGPFPDDIPNLEKSGLFLYLNTDKKSITLDIETASGIKIMKELLAETDLFIQNLPPRTISRLGLEYDNIRSLNPRLVMTSVSPFGSAGPYRDYLADDMVCFALGGLMYLHGDLDASPLKLAGYPASYASAIVGVTASLIGLEYQEATGNGQHVDVSAMEAVVASDPRAVPEYIYTGRTRMRGPQVRMMVFPCKDGIIAAGTWPEIWPLFAEFVGRPELMDERFANIQQRREHYPEMLDYVVPFMLQHTKKELCEKGHALGIPFQGYADVEEIMTNPHRIARGSFVEIDHPEAGPLMYPRLPLVMGGAREQPNPAPTLGQHNTEVYCQLLGYSKQDMIILRERGII